MNSFYEHADVVLARLADRKFYGAYVRILRICSTEGEHTGYFSQSTNNFNLDLVFVANGVGKTVPLEKLETEILI